MAIVGKHSSLILPPRSARRSRLAGHGSPVTARRSRLADFCEIGSDSFRRIFQSFSRPLPPTPHPACGHPLPVGRGEGRGEGLSVAPGTTLISPRPDAGHVPPTLVLPGREARLTQTTVVSPCRASRYAQPMLIYPRRAVRQRQATLVHPCRAARHDQTTVVLPRPAAWHGETTLVLGSREPFHRFLPQKNTKNAETGHFCPRSRRREEADFHSDARHHRPPPHVGGYTCPPKP